MGLETFMQFEVKSLPDMEVTYWQETYRNGELVEKLSWGETYSPAPGTQVEKGYRWSLYRPPGNTNQIRLSSGMDEDGRGLINDPFVGYSGPSAIVEPEEWHVPAGQPQLIWYAFWQPEEQKSIGWDASSEEGLKKLPLVILVKCEFRPAVPNRRGIEVKAFSGLPKDSKE